MHQISKVTKCKEIFFFTALREKAHLPLLFNTRAMKANEALRKILFIFLLLFFETKGKGREPFGLAEVKLRVAEFFDLRGRAKDGGMERRTGRKER